VSEQDQDKAAKRAQWEEINRAKALAKQQAQEAAAQTTSAPPAPKKQFQAIKGTRDLLPPETALWNRVEQTARQVFATFNFGEIRLPIFEPTDLFARAVGDDTDIVGKEMYSFTPASDRVNPNPNMAELGAHLENIKRLFEAGEIPKTPFNKLAIEEAQKTWSELESLAASEDKVPKLDRLVVFIEAMKLGDSISLRPEATASVCRAYVEHSMQQLPQPVKLYYMGPMFRRERPQKGRYRQFYQIGAEVLGGQDAPAIDAEVIEMLMTFFDKLNHNAPNCRPAYVEKLRAALNEVKDKLGEDSRRRIDTNPLRVLDSKLDFEQPIIATLPRIADHLCDECRSHYAAVKTQLQLRGVIYRENWRLVRGLDYYMRTTFEITAKGLGSQNAVCGGGRYDGLVELLGGPPTKGIGFAIGEDRLILSLQDQARESAAQAAATPATENQSPVTSHHSPLTAKQPPLIFIAWMGHNTYATAVRAAKDLRTAGFPVELPPTELKFGKALGQADKLGATYALILGENEVSENLWTLKNLTDGAQVKLPEPDLIAHLRQSV
jgi:histidyl-tRNA synthetase